MNKNTLVYRHLRLSNNEVFYIGIGNEKRPYSKGSRNPLWKNIVKKDGYKIEIRVCVEGTWYDTIREAGEVVSNRTTVLNRCKNPNWDYFREGVGDPVPN